MFKQMPTLKFYRVGLNVPYIVMQESEILNCQHILSLHHLLDIHSEDECSLTDWKFNRLEVQLKKMVCKPNLYLILWKT